MKYRSTLITLTIAVIILTLISTSAMAISKSDLISSYKSQSGSSLKPMISPTPAAPIPSTPSEISSFQRLVMPTPTSSSGNLYLLSRFSSSSGKLTVSPTPTPTPTPTPVSTVSVLNTCPPDIPIGELHFGRIRYTDGTYLYNVFDDDGTRWRVGEGCSCTCTYYDLNAGWDVVKTGPCDSLFK